MYSCFSKTNSLRKINRTQLRVFSYVSLNIFPDAAGCVQTDDGEQVPLCNNVEKVTTNKQ